MASVMRNSLSQQRLRLLQVSGVKALGEPAVDRCQQRTGFGALALLLPQPAQAHGGPQLQRFGLLAAGHGEGLLEAGFRLLRLCDCLLQQQFAPEPIQLRLPPAHPALGQRRQRLGQRLQPLGDLPHLGGHLGEQGQVKWAVPSHP